MICTCGCRTSYCEKTLTGHSERCQSCGRIEYYASPEVEFGKDIVDGFTLFPKMAAMLSERHSRIGVGAYLDEY